MFNLTGTQKLCGLLRNLLLSGNELKENTLGRNLLVKVDKLAIINIQIKESRQIN